MTHTNQKPNPWSYRYSLWVVVLMAFVVPLCGWSLRQIHLENETQQWVSDNNAERLASQWTQERFHLQDRILLTWAGSSINDPRLGPLVDHLAGKPEPNGGLRGGLPYVRSVVDPRPLLEAMQKNDIEAHESVRRLAGTLIGTGPMKIRLTEYSRSALKKSKRDLQSAFKNKFGQDLEVLDAVPDLTSLVSIPVPAKEDGSAADPSPPAVLSVEGSLIENAPLDHDLQVAWKGMHPGGESTIAIARWMKEYIPERNGGMPIVENCFFIPGSPAALEIELSEAGFADQSETVAAIRSACRQVGIPAETVRMSGHALAETQLNEATLTAAWDTAAPLYQINQRSILLTSILASVVLAFGLIRKIRVTSMIVVVSLFAACCTMAIVPMAKSTVNQILIILPTLLVALTISNAMQVYWTWKKAALEKESTAIAETVRDSRINCFRALCATALCLMTLCTVKLSPIWDLGIYGALGSVLSAMLVIFGLPSLIQVWNIKPTKENPAESMAWKFFGRLLTTHSGLQSFAVVGVCVGCGASIMFAIQAQPYREWPDNSKISQDYRNIEDFVAGTMDVDAVIRFDQQAQKDVNFLDRMEIVRSVEDQLRHQSSVSGCLSVTDFQPVTDRPTEDAGFSQRTKYNRRAAMAQQAIIDGEMPIARMYYSTPDQNQPASLKSESASLNQPGDELWRISAKVRGVSNSGLAAVLGEMHQIIKGELKMQPGSNYSITGELPQFVNRVETVTTSLFGSFVMSCVIVLGLLSISQKNISAGLLMMIPCIGPIAIVFGILSLAGVRMDFEMLMAPSIAMALMVDGKLRFLNQIKKATQEGLTRLEAAVQSFVDCGPMMCKATSVFAIAFFVLAQSELPFISRFGLMMFSLISVSLLTDLILLPQLIAGPLGWIFASPKAAVAETATIVSPEVLPTAQTTPTISEVDAIPSPHIKPHVPPAKKRRSASRREPDPE